MRTLLSFLIGFIIAFIFIKNSSCKCSSLKDEIIAKLGRQAARWTTAAAQDKNLMIKVLHANYGMAFLNAIKEISTSEEFKRATGLDIMRFENEILYIQDNVTRSLNRKCKGFGPKQTYLTGIGGEGT